VSDRQLGDCVVGDEDQTPTWQVAPAFRAAAIAIGVVGLLSIGYVVVDNHTDDYFTAARLLR
jgi:hypothetical protein